MDYPRLIRLNPDVPWKTRGNGAVALQLDVPDDKFTYFFDRLESLTKMYYNIEVNTNPGIIVLYSEKTPKEFISISKKALIRLVSVGEVIAILNKYKETVDYRTYGNGRGLVGAMASLGNHLLDGDYTYELIAYRPLNIRSRDRSIDATTLLERDVKGTFANYDYETRKLLISPHGPDPVVMGIRGETPNDVYRNFRSVRVLGDLEGWMIFVTNQGTSDNLKSTRKICEITPYNQCIISGVLVDRPMLIEGGHISLKVDDGTGDIDVMVYEPSGNIRSYANALTPGTMVTIGGGTKPKNNMLTLNTEVAYYTDVKLKEKIKPICPKCKISMMSLGKAKGYQCRKCGYHVYLDDDLITYRTIRMPGILLPPLRSTKHLTKPLKRLGREHKKRKRGIYFDNWIGILS